MKYVALLRGVNVGGKNILPMKELVQMFVKAGCRDVATYIQSGNVVFSAPAAVVKKLPAQITAAIEKRFGHKVPVVLRSNEQLARTIEGHRFIKAGKDPKICHVLFLADTPTPQAVQSLDPNRSPGDFYEVSGGEIYLHLPNGAAKTKLTNAYFDSKLATTCTGRNWATVLKLHGMSACE
jgi:uncharacterized protein (DUF1697 family)